MYFFVKFDFKIHQPYLIFIYTFFVVDEGFYAFLSKWAFQQDSNSNSAYYYLKFPFLQFVC